MERQQAKEAIGDAGSTPSGQVVGNEPVKGMGLLTVRARILYKNMDLFGGIKEKEYLCRWIKDMVPKTFDGYGNEATETTARRHTDLPKHH